MSPDDVPLTFGDADPLDRLEPLRLALFDHHADVGGAGLPLIARDDDTWPLRWAFYATTVMLAALAGNDGALRFYERRGMVPIATWLMRLGPRPGQSG